MRVLGLMSGTSADGIDAVLATFDGPPQRPRWRILASHAHPYPALLRERLVALGQGQPLRAAELLELTEAVTEAQAAAARACDPEGLASLVGCHGQTVWHRPPAPGRRGASWQMLQGPLLARLLERPVVYDFRSADLALGGQFRHLADGIVLLVAQGIDGVVAHLDDLSRVDDLDARVHVAADERRVDRLRAR